MKQIDFLVVGHVSRDIVPTGHQAGGTAVFSSRTAHALGCHTAVFTSASADFDLSQVLPGILLHRIVAEESTTFQNIYAPGGRQQILHARAAPLTAEDIPQEWLRSGIVHLAPISDEVDPNLIHVFSNSLVGLTPQGWLRRWTDEGHVYRHEWTHAEPILRLAAAVVLSEEDLPSDSTLSYFRQHAPLVVLTQGKEGCTVFLGDEVRQVPAPSVTEVEPTGAGDIFAAAFLVRLHQTAGNPWEAARFANELAAQSVTQAEFAAKINHMKAHVDMSISSINREV